MARKTYTADDRARVRFQRCQQCLVVCVCHFVPILLSAARFKQIRRICIDQHVLVPETPNQLQRRAILYLYFFQPLGRGPYVLGHIVPAVQAVTTLTRINVDFESGLLIRLEAVPHPAPDTKPHRTVEVCFAAILVRIVKYCARIWRQVDFPGKPLGVCTQDAEKIHDIPVDVVHGLDRRAQFAEQHSQRTGEQLQIGSVRRHNLHDFLCHAPLCTGVIQNRIH